jgi:alpha-glucosidase
VQSSHDRSRAVTRYGGGAVGRRRALALATLTVGLPALPVLFQGEELGLDDGHVPADRVRDPLALRGGYALPRDVARTPMPWAPGPGLGFTTAAEAWVPFGGREPADTVARQWEDDGSSLAAHRRLLATRRRLADLRRGEVVWVDAQPPVLAYRRGTALVAANTGPSPAALDLPEGRWAVEFSTDPAGPPAPDGGRVVLGAEQAVVLARRGG